MALLATGTEKQTKLVVEALPEVVREALKTKELCVAGGFPRDVLCGKEPSDIDLFGSDWPFGEKETGYRQGKCVTFTKIAKLPVQWIYVPDGYSRHILTTFDSPICQVWLDWDRNQKQWRMTGPSQAWMDLEDRVVKYRPGCGSAAKSYWHFKKLIQKGYKPAFWTVPEYLGDFVEELLRETGKFGSDEFLRDLMFAMQDQIYAKAYPPTPRALVMNREAMLRAIATPTPATPGTGSLVEVDAYGNPRTGMALNENAPREAEPHQDTEGVPVGGGHQAGNGATIGVQSSGAEVSGVDYRPTRSQEVVNPSWDGYRQWAIGEHYYDPNGTLWEYQGLGLWASREA